MKHFSKQLQSILTELEAVREDGNPTWNISRDTGIFLNTLLRKIQPKRALEIGTSTGYSGMWIAEALSHHDGKLITVESHDGRFEQAQINFSKSGLTNITQVAGHAPEILEQIEGTFDFMFFDATKYEHISYFETLEKRLNPGGVIITDNVLSHAEELKPYRELLESKPTFQSCIIPIGTGLMMSVKLN